MESCANTFVSPAAQDDPAGAAEAKNAEGSQQAVWVQPSRLHAFVVNVRIKNQHCAQLETVEDFLILCKVKKMIKIWFNSMISFVWPAAKADKKAAQVKIQQQEHKRQVCVCEHVWGLVRQKRLCPPISSYCWLFTLQEREGELRAMARKIRMK